MKVKLSVLEPRWLLVIVFFIAGTFMGGIGLYLYFGVSNPTVIKVHPGAGRYKYINPILVVDTNTKQSARENSLALELQGLTDKAKKEGKISDAAFYFRDIEPGLWVGINENYKFSPGKLLKIPIMITYYKLAEANPAILDEKITFRTNRVVKEDLLGTPKNLEEGITYTVDELIDAMIVDSDDNVANLLFDHIDKDQMNEIFSDLGIDFKETKETQDYISLKLYSLFFRVLYNSTYLNREYSEKALSLLIRTTSDQSGLGVLLPKNIDFANRQGAHQIGKGPNKSFEMYDCGIVYYPGHNYLICSVATGNSLDSLKSFLAEVGNRVYTEVKYQYR